MRMLILACLLVSTSAQAWTWKDLFRVNTCSSATYEVCQSIKRQVAEDKARWEARERVKAARIAEGVQALTDMEPSWCTPEAYALWYSPGRRVAPELGPKFRRECPRAYARYLDMVDGYEWAAELQED